ncbi:MAG: Ribonuclease PH [Alphaproteobacteria bacterium MarineAlpha5_Bin11]|nr:ribonuclease PH [Pelagibacteraceae bacterium]PPR44849.1 MAG: Ribonuclease PH [Alphaproteobacteria bacterium MarineAlpha5_Bin11]PPR51819.1 MAG: Ribonuclease PH [Alphaproteobacteria bacterium MarineAlpha5_Bin10]|tara:strand:- start:3273 stop:3992 length:720 start_codon:yes stop_codon:yes gene_type:complete
MRKDRLPNQLRNIEFIVNFNNYAEGSCLAKFGNTHVICTATIEEKIPPWLKNKGLGWITAEYGMIPRSTSTRMDREASRGKQSGRTNEIQRLIGRSLRSIVDMEKIGERQIKIDCDVIQADGGTRTASISGAFLALAIAIKKFKTSFNIKEQIIKESIAAVSCGIIDNDIYLDLDYSEDSSADVDANFVMSENKKIIEVQSTAEGNPFSKEQFIEMMDLAYNGISLIIKKQKDILGKIE